MDLVCLRRRDLFINCARRASTQQAALRREALLLLDLPLLNGGRQKHFLHFPHGLSSESGSRQQTWKPRRVRNSPKKHTHKINPGSVACWKRVQCLFPRKGTVQLFTGEQNSVEVFLSGVKTARGTQASLPPPPVVFETRHCGGGGGGGSASHTFTPPPPHSLSHIRGGPFLLWTFGNVMGTAARAGQQETSTAARSS